MAGGLYGRYLIIIHAAIALTFPMPCAAGALEAPKWVAALHIPAQKAVGLRWTAVTGATGYQVLRSTTSGGDFRVINDSSVHEKSAPQYFSRREVRSRLGWSVIVIGISFRAGVLFCLPKATWEAFMR